MVLATLQKKSQLRTVEACPKMCGAKVVGALECVCQDTEISLQSGIPWEGSARPSGLAHLRPPSACLVPAGLGRLPDLFSFLVPFIAKPPQGHREQTVILS